MEKLVANKSERALHLTTALAVAISLVLAANAPAQGENAPVVLPKSPPPFDGKIGPSYETSTPGTPFEVRAPQGAPNVLLIMTDDVGFGASSTFGGMVPTPNLDTLAAQGLRYNRFHVAAMCSPTRAALLTGRNHHAVGQGIPVPMGSEFPGYDIRFPKSAASIAEILKDNGYATAMFGKHHNTNKREMSIFGPHDNWPTGLGFEYFYGFMLGETDQFAPKLYEGTVPVDLSNRGKDYILDKDLADHAIHWIDGQAAAIPHHPFFIYYATGSTHAPQQAPKEWIAKFREKFDAGWDVLRKEIYERQKQTGIIPAGAALAPRPSKIPAWDSLGDTDKRVFARFMEVYAAQLSYQDAQIGRVFDELKRIGEFDNTLIIFIEGDNGASMEGGVVGKVLDYGQAFNGLKDSVEWGEEFLDKLGGPDTAPIYPAGWAWAMNTPFPWAKRVASHLGGTRDGLVVSWTRHVKDPNIVRSQYTHVTDIMPTILEATGVPAPDIVNGVKQQPFNGISFAYTFEAPNAPSRHNTQYYELMGNRGIYHDGWLANTTPDGPPWQTDKEPAPVLDYQWELYNLAEDYSQAHNVAAQYPERLKELSALWLEEARRNQVLPLDNRWFRPSSQANPPSDYVFWGKDVSVPMDASPPIYGKSFRLVADVTIAGDHETGVIASVGGHFGGWSFYLMDGKPTVYQTYSNQEGAQFRISSQDALKPGQVTITYDFAYDAPGRYKGGLMRISVNGKEVAQGRIDRTINRPLPDGETFDVGRDLADKVSPDYQGSAPFAGEIHKVSVHTAE